MQSMQALFVSPFFLMTPGSVLLGKCVQIPKPYLSIWQHSCSNTPFHLTSLPSKKQSGKLSLRHCLEKLMTSGVNLASTWGFRVLLNLVLTFAPKFRFSALWYRTNVVACVVFLPSSVCSLKSRLSAAACINFPATIFEGISLAVSHELNFFPV